MSDEVRRVVWLRNGEDGRHLKAYLDDDGALHIDGHDLGGAELFGLSDYEWFEEIDAQDVHRVVELLGGSPGEDVLDLLERDWVGPSRSREFEVRLDESDISVERFVR